MSSALIGYTGFVGSNLAAQLPFDARYNSKNVEEIGGRAFDVVFCAAAPAEKWRANADPATDLASIERLMRALSDVRASRFVLISTIDVYPRPREVDESTPIDSATLAPYGRHRLMLESFVRERFPATVLRLPGLFGPGLRKNALFDLIHDNAVDRIDSRGRFQFYGVSRLAADVERALDRGIAVLNVATPPLSISDIARTLFGRELETRGAGPAPDYDFRSIHCRAWGRDDGYLYSRETVMSDLRAFVETETRSRSTQ